MNVTKEMSKDQTSICADSERNEMNKRTRTK
jgi:hypothetical protein